ncbi:class I SAM-dependent methyltransferase [Aquihabitans sp. McL0605]|uniref:class I SAM-dependent methyltransferase n=1 Tax=Aquihabitans sp. McL0605 TaxID=3415671 RepID=UPI003CEAE2E4
MALDVDDAALKALQADNFDNLNEMVADSPFDRHVRFFNFGYRPLGDDQPVGPALGAGFPNKDSAQLLFQVIGDTDLAAKRVAEVGCGRGGNLWLVRRSFGPASVTGVDIAYRSIAYCRSSMPEPDAQFVVADAERVPLGTGSADIVLSVETSCTYPRIESFFREVARILTVGGHFLYTDLMQVGLIEPFIATLTALGMELEHRRDITPNVSASRDARAARQKLAYGTRPDDDSAAVLEYVGESGSHLYELLTNDEYQYTILRFRKVADIEPPAGDLLSAEAQAAVRDLAELAVELLTVPSLPPTSD